MRMEEPAIFVPGGNRLQSKSWRRTGPWKRAFYGKGMDLGQQHYLIPEEVEKTVDDHMYVVSPGDCLWNIAYKHYGHGEYYDLIYRMNWNVIGGDEDLLLPGMRLYVPEVGNAEDTIGSN